MIITRADRLPHSVQQADFSFGIDKVVVEPFDAATLHVETVPARRKHYGLDDALFEPRDQAERALFLACQEDSVAGYIAASRDWNGCALIDDLAVARTYRRRGIASALMDPAVDWALTSAMRTIRLETQSNNVTAIRLYMRYGFVLGGHDRYLYRKLGPERADEVALFLYLDASARRQGAE